VFKLRLNVRGIFDNIGFKIGTRRELQPFGIDPEMAGRCSDRPNGNDRKIMPAGEQSRELGRARRNAEKRRFQSKSTLKRVKNPNS